MALLTANILIVEDDELNCELLKRRLEAAKYKVSTVSTGTQALKLITEQKFDLVLLDIMLPDINGVKVLEQIKQDPNNASLQIIMLTANSEREMVLKCLDGGAADYLTKPFSMSIVKERIQRNLENVFSQQYDINSSKILLVDDQELNRDVLAHRLQKIGYEVTSVTDGSAALDILKTEVFDLIMLDIMMPNISGIDVLKKLRKMPEHNDSAVIMVTALDDVGIINECMEAGANDYLTKPLNTVLLKLRISSCLQSHQLKINHS